MLKQFIDFKMLTSFIKNITFNIVLTLQHVTFLSLTGVKC